MSGAPLTIEWVPPMYRVAVLNQELTQRHGLKLEWIVIWLIAAEVIIAVGWDIIVKDVFGFFSHSN